MPKLAETTDLKRLQQRLEQHGQEHLLTFYPELTPTQQQVLLKQLDSLNWEYLDELITSYFKSKPDLSLPESLEPPPYYPVTEAEPGHYAKARELGKSLIRAGQVAAFTVAGGQGTRLGWDDPKGTYPATALSNKPLFQLFAEQLQKTGELYGTTVPWYIMTSQTNHGVTQDFFDAHDYFGLERENVMLFPQGMMPSIGYDGQLLLSEKYAVALNPDGHGGSLSALEASGALADMERRGITQISYFQVDNPNVHTIDPLFIGLHVDEGAEMSSKMLRKASAKEKVGVFCVADGKIAVIEYSDMPDELAQATHEDGSLQFAAGSIAIHVISLSFALKLARGRGDRLALPLHRAEKKVPYVDPATGERVKPSAPNAIKLERFIFDALPLAKHSIILETDRVEEFAPIKNADGTDSPASSKRLQTERAARWLEANGVKVPRDENGEVDAVIEISPLTALSAEDLANLTLPEAIEPGAKIIL